MTELDAGELRVLKQLAKALSPQMTYTELEWKIDSIISGMNQFTVDMVNEVVGLKEYTKQIAHAELIDRHEIKELVVKLIKTVEDNHILVWNRLDVLEQQIGYLKVMNCTTQAENPLGESITPENGFVASWDTPEGQSSNWYDVDLYDEFFRDREGQEWDEKRQLSRAAKLLKSHNINTIGDLADYSETTLLKLKGVGPGLLHYIEGLLKKLGLSLKK